MKKSVKKLMSVVMAMSCMMSAAAMNTNAVKIDYPEITENGLEGYVEFDAQALFPYWNERKNEIRYFWDGVHKNRIFALTVEPAHFSFLVPYDREDIYAPANSHYMICDMKDIIINKYGDEDIEAEEHFTSYETVLDEELGMYRPISSCCRARFYHGRDSEKSTMSYIRDVYNEFKEMADVREFKYADRSLGVSYVATSYMDDMTDYALYSKSDFEGMKKYLEKYAADSDGKFTLETDTIYKVDTEPDEEPQVSYYRCHLVPADDVTIEEHCKAAVTIQNELEQTDKMLYYAVKLGVGINEPHVKNESTLINVSDSIDGDANEDGSTNIADATAIVQAIGNPDKYKLTPQGEFNADTNGDGLTGLDAIAVQMKLISQ